MAVNNILPQYQAEERSAEVRVHPVPMPNHMDMAGRLLSQAGGDIQKVAFGVALDMKRRKDETDERNRALLMSEKTAALTTDVTKRVTELMKLQGTEASGATAMYEKAFQTALNQHSSGLGIEDMRKFRAWANQLYISNWKSVNGHEYQQITQANVQLCKDNARQLGSTYAMKGDADSLAQYEGECTRVWEAMGRSTDAPEYEGFMRDNRDQAISSHVDYLLRQGKAEDALDYYDRMATRVSPAMKAQIEPRLADASNDRINRGRAGVFLGEINGVSGDKSLGGRYPSAARQQAYAKKDQELAASADPNDKITRQYLREIFQADTEVKEATLAADYAELTSKMAVEDTWGNVLSNISYLDFLLPTMPDSELKDRLQTLHDKLVDHEKGLQSEQNAKTRAEQAEARERAAAAKAAYAEWEKDPLRQATAAFAKTAAARSDHKVYFNGMSFNLKEPGQRNAFFLAAGDILTKQDKELITATAEGQYHTGERTQACYDIMQYMKTLAPKETWTQDTVNFLMPDLVDEYMMVRARWTQNGKVTGKAVEDALQTWLVKQLVGKRDATGYAGFWNKNTQEFKWFASKAINSDGTINPKFDVGSLDTLRFAGDEDERADAVRKREDSERGLNDVIYGGRRERKGRYEALDAFGGR